jgi:hypothetical protein
LADRALPGRDAEGDSIAAPAHARRGIVDLTSSDSSGRLATGARKQFANSLTLAVIEGLPTAIFIDRAGKVVYVHIGQYDSFGNVGRGRRQPRAGRMRRRVLADAAYALREAHDRSMTDAWRAKR